MRIAPRNAATNCGESGSSSATRCSISSPRRLSPAPVRATRSASSAYVSVSPSYRRAGRPPRPAAMWGSSSAAARLKVSVTRLPGLEVLPAREAIGDSQVEGRDLRLHLGDVLLARALVGPLLESPLDVALSASGAGLAEHVE